MSSNSRARVCLIGLVALAAPALAAPAAQAGDAHYEGVSADGRVAVFSVVDGLVPGDTDSQRDVYVRAFEAGHGYVTREASLGPTGGNDAYPAQFQAIDTTGEELFFSTRERLVEADTDDAIDIYVRDLTANQTTLVSAGSAACQAAGCGNADVEVGAVPGGVVDDGDEVFFVSAERLAAGDTDSSPDIYARDLQAGTTTLVSAPGSPCSGSCGSGAAPAFFRGAASDGSKAIFTTAESLVDGDADGESDLYERDLGGGVTRLVSAPGPGPEPCPAASSCDPVNSAISADGSHVFFETNERATAADGDASQDVYGWSAGAAQLISSGPAGGDGPANALFEGSSSEGDDVFFATAERLVGADDDDAQDVYVRRGATTELVSAGDPSCAASECGNGPSPALLQWIAPDGSLAVFNTVEPLTDADADGAADVYSRALPGGPTVLVSVPGPTCTDPGCGAAELNAGFAGASADGSDLFFVTEEALAPPAAADPGGPGDRDERTDVYERSGGATTLVSAGQLGGSGPYAGNGPFDSQLPAQGVSADGSRALLVSREQLTGEDGDASEDVYLRADGGTLLVSRSNDSQLEAELAPPTPVLAGTNPDSPGASLTPKVLGGEPAVASIKLYATVGCSGQPIATGSSAQLKSSGIPISVAAGSTTFLRATAEAGGFVSPCSAPIAYTHKSGSGSAGGGAVSASQGAAGGGLRVTRSLVFEYGVPQTRITFGPAFKTRVRRPVFRFTDATEQLGTHFTCKLDRRRWRSCSSPVQLQRLDRGRHVFQVKGVNAVGVWEANPSKRAFKVVAG